MNQVFLHTKNGKSEWKNTGREFLRLPIIGEFLTLHTKSKLYKVIAVIHCPHQKPQYVAEVFAIETEETISTLT